MARIPADVVIEERDDLALIPRDEVLQHALAFRDVAHDHLRRPNVEARADTGERAEIAGEGAAPRCLERERDQIFLREQIEPRYRNRLGVVWLGQVAWPQRSAL